MKFDLVQEMVDHAIQDAPNEACGLIVVSRRTARIIRAKNLAQQPRIHFDLDPEAWMEVGLDEEVVGVYHSHPLTGPQPSMADLVACEAAQLPFHIVTPEGHHTITNPSGFQAPLEGRPYIYRILDCYSIVRDWYQFTWGIELKDYQRDHEFWDKGQNLYVENFADAGFVSLPEGSEKKIGDVFLIQFGDTPVPNHAGVYVGEGLMLHHAQSRLSRKEPYGGMWERHTTHHLRHRDRLAHG